MNILLKLIPNKICLGCACHGYVDEKTYLCCACYGIKIAVEERKRKLSATMRAIFAPQLFNGHVQQMKEKIRRQMEEFRTKSASA
jgi:hypothetical protein